MYFNEGNVIFVDSRLVEDPRLVVDQVHQAHRQRVRIDVLQARFGAYASPFSEFTELENRFRDPSPALIYFALASTDARFRFNLEKLILPSRGLPENVKLVLPSLHPPTFRYSQGFVLKSWGPSAAIFCMCETGSYIFHATGRRLEECVSMIP